MVKLQSMLEEERDTCTCLDCGSKCQILETREHKQRPGPLLVGCPRLDPAPGPGSKHRQGAGSQEPQREQQWGGKPHRERGPQALGTPGVWPPEAQGENKTSQARQPWWHQLWMKGVIQRCLDEKVSSKGVWMKAEARSRLSPAKDQKAIAVASIQKTKEQEGGRRPHTQAWKEALAEGSHPPSPG